MNSESEYHNVTKWLDGSRRPMLITHRRPDGDALGALGGLAMALRQRGIEPLAALFDPFPPRYALIQDAAEWYQWDRDRAKLEAECDGLIILDTCALTQLEPIADYLPQAPRTLVLDHHTTRDDIGTRPGDLRLIDESASAVALMVAEWAQAAGVKMEPLLATALLVGISTDCGWFRFSNTDARTLRVSADLVAAGANASEIHAAIYEQDAPEKLRVIARMLASLELHAGGKLAAMFIRQSDLTAAGADRSVTDDLVNEARRLGCTEATVLFTEEGDETRINFRSKRTVDVAALARQFGGGGHARAAGARQRGKFDEVAQRVIAAVTAEIEALEA